MSSTPRYQDNKTVTLDYNAWRQAQDLYDQLVQSGEPSKETIQNLLDVHEQAINVSGMGALRQRIFEAEPSEALALLSTLMTKSHEMVPKIENIGEGVYIPDGTYDEEPKA